LAFVDNWLFIVLYKVLSLLKLSASFCRVLSVCGAKPFILEIMSLYVNDLIILKLLKQSLL